MKAKHVISTDGQHYGYRFHCPGCNEEHLVTTPPYPQAKWGFEGDESRPTFSPSIFVHSHEALREDGTLYETFRCHSFVKDGRIQFLSDSTHQLAGQTVDLPELE